MININKSKICSKHAIITMISTIIIPIIYISTIINMSGFGESIGSNDITIKLCMVIVMFFYIINIKNGIKKSFLILSLISFVFISTSIINREYYYPIKILILISSIYTFSFIGRTEYSVKLVSYLYPFMTIYILYDFNMDGITGGWNTNVIGMIGFIGVICVGYNFFDKSKILKIINLVILINIITLLEVTDNRSAYLGIAVALLLNIIIYKFRYKEKKLKLVSLLIYCIPVLIVILMIALYRSPIAEDLNRISIEYTEKPLFSGREYVWNYMISSMQGSWLLGYGKPIIGNAHNIFMHLLYAYGIIGYILYSLFFIITINNTYKYIEDYIVRYSIVAHLAVYIQQSFECILMDGVKVILVSYIFLIIAIGRCRYLEEKSKSKE